VPIGTAVRSIRRVEYKTTVRNSVSVSRFLSLKKPEIRPEWKKWNAGKTCIFKLGEISIDKGIFKTRELQEFL